MCYIFPVTSAVVTSIIWRRNKTSKTWWLSLMFYGGALFGVVDHLWNGELFLISKNWRMDLALGVVITAVILSAWGTILALAKRNPSLAGSLKS